MKPYDMIVIGSGPAGQQAALACARAGGRVGLVERDASVGGASLHRGTIPSKTLREAALRLCRLQQDGARLGATVPDRLRLEMLTEHLERVIGAQVGTIDGTLESHGIERLHGTARVVSSSSVRIERPGGASVVVDATTIVVATGSKPRLPPEIPVDHEQVLDSDSILSLEYLPASMTILGGGVIGCEYASIFAVLGVEVTIVDGAPRPLAFLDEDLGNAFRVEFEATGGRYLGSTKIERVEADGLCNVSTTLVDGRVIESERLMIALGRVPCIERLGLEDVGVQIDERGRVLVDAQCRTACPSVFAVGDVIGPPALASTSMEQGRRAALAALGLPAAPGSSVIPVGIYTIPEIAAVGLTEAQARQAHGDVLVGHARFSDVARGRISGETHGMLKLVADPAGDKILGVGIVGEGASELVALGQLAILLGGGVSSFIDNIFNFPTMAEAYRLAALDIATSARSRRRAA